MIHCTMTHACSSRTLKLSHNAEQANKGTDLKQGTYAGAQTGVCQTFGLCSSCTQLSDRSTLLATGDPAHDDAVLQLQNTEGESQRGAGGGSPAGHCRGEGPHAEDPTGLCQVWQPSGEPAIILAPHLCTKGVNLQVYLICFTSRFFGVFFCFWPSFVNHICCHWCRGTTHA